MGSLTPAKHEIVIDGFRNLYYLKFEQGFSHTPERHDFWEIVYVDKGHIFAVTDSVGSELTQGQVIFHEPGEIHAHISDKETTNHMLVISFTSSSPMMNLFRKKTFTLDSVCRARLSMFLREAKNALAAFPDSLQPTQELDFSQEKFGSSQLMECYFTEFLITLIRADKELSRTVRFTSESRMIAKNSTVSLIEDYLKTQLYSSVSLNDICRHFYLGKTQLSKIFREGTGKSPMEYFSDLKIEEAKRLLREETYSVSQISDLLGYSSIHNFSRAFKTAVGFSPTAYTKSVLFRRETE